jgi:hypothetical protein
MSHHVDVGTEFDDVCILYYNCGTEHTILGFDKFLLGDIKDFIWHIFGGWGWTGGRTRWDILGVDGFLTFRAFRRLFGGFSGGFSR